jgi:hypothetical protein
MNIIYRIHLDTTVYQYLLYLNMLFLSSLQVPTIQKCQAFIGPDTKIQKNTPRIVFLTCNTVHSFYKSIVMYSYLGVVHQ